MESNTFDLNQHPLANLAFFRSYSRRKNNNEKETWEEVCDRITDYLTELGNFLPEESELIKRQQKQCTSIAAGRLFWVAGTQWLDKPKNYSGAYNCTSLFLDEPRIFGVAATLAMCGSGVGLVIEDEIIENLPPISQPLTVTCLDNVGKVDKLYRLETTVIEIALDRTIIFVGDSKEGWVQAYQYLIDLAMGLEDSSLQVTINFGNVRPAGERILGFGGVANPNNITSAFLEIVEILNQAAKEQRRLNVEECCLVVDIMAKVIVLGNIRRSAGMKQGSHENTIFTLMKKGLWMQDENGTWKINPKKDALRMSNHTQVFHRQPTRQECIDSVKEQFFSGEGAIQYAPEAVYRSNVDIITPLQRDEFIQSYEKGEGRTWIRENYPDMKEEELNHRIMRYGLNPCITGDCWIHTESGPRQVAEIVGKPQSLYVDGTLFSTTEKGFFQKGYKPVFILITKEGYSLKATHDHKVNKVYCQSNCRQYTEFVEISTLKEGDQVKLHNHREMLIKWGGAKTKTEGQRIFANIHQQENLLNDENAHHVIALSSETSKSFLQVDCLQWSEFERFSFEFYIGFLSEVLNNLSCFFVERGSLHLKIKGSINILLILQRMFLRLGIFTEIISIDNGFSLLISPESVILSMEMLEISSSLKNQIAHWLEQNQHIPVDSFTATVKHIQFAGYEVVYDCEIPGPHFYDANGIHVHNCGEIIGKNYHCNLSEVHLKMIDPLDFEGQKDAFRAGALNVAALLNHQFVDELHQKSRELDPIVGVSFTGLFDFFVNLFGKNWLDWWVAGRNDFFLGQESDEFLDRIKTANVWLSRQLKNTDDVYDIPQKTVLCQSKYFLGDCYRRLEAKYLEWWKMIVRDQVFAYCDRLNLKRPNRYTTVQPSGTKSLLTNSSPGWHPPKGIYFIRRMTFRAYDPIALAAIDFGYTAIPSQNVKDDEGKLLDDPFDPRATEWLIEIPVKVDWADLADGIDPGQFSAIAQMDFSMQCQKHYVTHNTSATWELRLQEVEAFGDCIYRSIQKGEYISGAILARFDDYQSFPRLPFEPISKEAYERLLAECLTRRKHSDFHVLMNQRIAEIEHYSDSPQDMACSGLKCEIDINTHKS